MNDRRNKKNKVQKHFSGVNEATDLFMKNEKIKKCKKQAEYEEQMKEKTVKGKQKEV
jgi:hypothetical protein